MAGPVIRRRGVVGKGRIGAAGGAVGDAKREYEKAIREANRFIQKASSEAVKTAALSDAEIRDRLRLREADLETLDRIAEAPGRNAIAQLAAIKLKMQATVEPPKQSVGLEQTVTVVVKTMEDVGSVTLESKPVVTHMSLPVKEEE